MRTEKCLSLIFILFFFFLLGETPEATILNEHFGISLSVNGGGIFNNSWVPSTTTADYTLGDWPASSGAPNPSPFGSTGEAFDIEAIYFDNDSTYAYLAIVTSIPQSGYNGSLFGWNGYYFNPGDIAIDLNPADPAFNYQYGIKTTGPQAGTVKKDATWYYDKGSAGYPYGYPNQGFAQYPKFDVNTGTSMGNATYFDYYDTGLIENGWHTSVIEAKILLSLLGSPGSDTEVFIRMSPDCNNDLLFSSGDIDLQGQNEQVNIVPEPVTILLFSSGLVFIYMFGRKKIKGQM